ncbi:MAG: hypothetical protein WCK77_18845 [Verrucomicrobiota bacterium]
MNPSVEAIFHHQQLLDVGGLCGLGLVALAAARIARGSRSPGAVIMALGAGCLWLARVFNIISPHVLSDEVLLAIGVPGIALTIALPPLLLGFGLSGVVGGLWGHLRHLQRSSLALAASSQD